MGQINPVFATLKFQGHVWDTVGQRDTGTKIKTAAFSDGLLFYFNPSLRNACLPQHFRSIRSFRLQLRSRVFWIYANRSH